MKAAASAAPYGIARIAAPFCLGVGVCEVATGSGLIVRPELVLNVLGIVAPAGEALVYLRFVGVFVACVGAVYLLPLVMDAAGARGSRMRTAIELTAFFRLSVALFLAVAVLAGGLHPPWLFVATFDAAVALVQLALRQRGAFGSES